MGARPRRPVRPQSQSQSQSQSESESESESEPEPEPEPDNAHGRPALPHPGVTTARSMSGEPRS